MKRQRLAILVRAALLCGASGVRAAEQNKAGPDGAKLIGAWHIVSMEEQGQDGRLEHHTDRTGMLLFTLDGHFSVQVMYPESGVAAANPTYAKDGYEATFGSYNVDEQTHSLRQHVQAALVRTLIGRDLSRLMQFSSDGHLTLRSVRSEEKWSVTWEHE
jgi:Lipocalin-like domain